MDRVCRPFSPSPPCILLAADSAFSKRTLLLPLQETWGILGSRPGLGFPLGHAGRGGGLLDRDGDRARDLGTDESWTSRIWTSRIWTWRSTESECGAETSGGCGGAGSYSRMGRGAAYGCGREEQRSGLSRRGVAAPPRLWCESGGGHSAPSRPPSTARPRRPQRRARGGGGRRRSRRLLGAAVPRKAHVQAEVRWTRRALLSTWRGHTLRVGSEAAARGAERPRSPGNWQWLQLWAGGATSSQAVAFHVGTLRKALRQKSADAPRRRAHLSSNCV
ncbi:hypothetical protein P7K49_012150 [Saguinus oedipus]|uniref:Uncharacterized protein n=1 Tax=Saguinus oedipus TaxID=9490 RepID=A0ABQ9VV17_SAGOE|nr:hypothetical protein P7K49_012150 [Saguinus oedipus]